MYICQNKQSNIVENIIKKEFIKDENILKATYYAYGVYEDSTHFIIHLHSFENCHNFNYCLN